MRRWGASKSRRSAAASVESLAKFQIGGTPNVQPLFIPPRTRAELATPAPRGQRHEQMKKIVLPLLANGLTPTAVFVQLREMYELDVSDGEICDLITWAASHNPQPCRCNWKSGRDHAQNLQRLVPERVTAKQAVANTQKWLG